MVHNATIAKVSKRDISNIKKWITKEEFYKVFPTGYRECNFFSSPIEFWAMSKEACWNWEQTALINLSSELNWQRNLQQTFLIGHSSDSKLLTELLHENNNDSNIESPMNTSINNDVNIDPDVLSKKISISKNKKCFTCNNVCKCSGLLSNRSKNHFKNNNCETVSLLSKSLLVLPEIKLIDNFDKSSIKSLLSKTNLNLPIYIPDNIQSRSTTPLDNRVVTERDTCQIIRDETNVAVVEATDDESNEYDKNVLKYFHLNSISDIFQDLQDDFMGMAM